MNMDQNTLKEIMEYGKPQQIKEAAEYICQHDFLTLKMDCYQERELLMQAVNRLYEFYLEEKQQIKMPLQ